ncbi:MAG: hypothetical protein HZA52_13490 [Planctomycetes bacterium]|nr:hypothetical protein [Planctomycetota bacterium]
MNRTVGMTVACLALCAGAFSLAPTPPAQSDLQKEVERLRVEVAELKNRSRANGDLETLRAELKDANQKLVETFSYLNAQADAAQHLNDALLDADKKGFTFGINPDSRVALLQGFQAYCEGLQKDVPGRKPEVEPVAGQ